MHAILLAATLAVPSGGKIREEFDIKYDTSSPRQTLDVFSPAEGKNHPVVVFAHGGTWMVGDKDFFGVNRNAGRMLARNGFVAVLANYRLTPAVRHPSHARDFAAAFAWTRKNIARHGGDPARMILAGHSAGGHLATLVASDQSFLGEEDRKAICCVVGICGVYRIPGAEEYAKIAATILEGWKRARPEVMKVAAPVLSFASPVLNPFWLVFGSDRAGRLKASPLHHVKRGLPPFLLLYTESEPPTLDDMAWDMARALLLAGVPAELKLFDGCNHRTIMRRLHRDDDAVTKTVLAFLAKHARAAK